MDSGKQPIELESKDISLVTAVKLLTVANVDKINLLRENTNLKKEVTELKERLRETKKSLVDLTSKNGVYPKEVPKALLSKRDKSKFFPEFKKPIHENKDPYTFSGAISTAIESAVSAVGSAYNLNSPNTESDSSGSESIINEACYALKGQFSSPRPHQLNFLEALFTMDNLIRGNSELSSDSDSDNIPMTDKLSDIPIENSLPVPENIPPVPIIKPILLTKSDSDDYILIQP